VLASGECKCRVQVQKWGPICIPATHHCLGRPNWAPLESNFDAASGRTPFGGDSRNYWQSAAPSCWALFLALVSGNCALWKCFWLRKIRPIRRPKTLVRRPQSVGKLAQTVKEYRAQKWAQKRRSINFHFLLADFSPSSGQPEA